MTHQEKCNHLARFMNMTNDKHTLDNMTEEDQMLALEILGWAAQEVVTNPTPKFTQMFNMIHKI